MKERKFVLGTSVILIIVFIVIAAYAFIHLGQFWNKEGSRQPEEIKKAILKASVQCYALEGSYPPDLEYLEKHYGLQLDEDHFFYVYEVFASNVAPDVEVYEK